MKGSTRRWSLGSIHLSGSKVSLLPSPSGSGQAILQGRSETSKASMRLAPLSPFSKRFHVASTPLASGVTMPRPVTTTRRMLPFPPCPIIQAAPVSGSGRSVFFEELDRVADGHDGLGRIIRDLDVELFLEGHH